MKRILVVLFLLCSLALGQTVTATIISAADITGNGASHVLQASVSARWVQIINVTGNSAVVRIGDSSVSSTRGAAIAVGGGLMLPPIPSTSSTAMYYNLGTIYYYAANGDKISLIWGK